MIDTSSFYIGMANREGFNTSVRHINHTLELVDSCNPKANIADEINRLLTIKAIDEHEVPAVINMLLIDKWKYAVVSRNIASIVGNSAIIIEEIAKLKGVDIVVGYHHPDLGFIVFNPKNPVSAAIIDGFRKNELVLVYAGTQNGNLSLQKANSAASFVLDNIEGKKTKLPGDLLSGPYNFVLPKKNSVVTRTKAKNVHATASRSVKNVPQTATPAQTELQPAPTVPAVSAHAPAVVPGRSRMSSLVSVVVTNELFHNGNVEAWKRIIRSYNARYPNLQVFIYYDGERIVDINTLFKWGKVKHGSCIQFCVAGENIQDLAKLCRYFRQGASPQFEAFLHGSPDTVMNLF